MGGGVLGRQRFALRALITAMSRASFGCLICDTTGSAANRLQARTLPRPNRAVCVGASQSLPAPSARCDGLLPSPSGRHVSQQGPRASKVSQSPSTVRPGPAGASYQPCGETPGTSGVAGRVACALPFAGDGFPAAFLDHQTLTCAHRSARRRPAVP